MKMKMAEMKRRIDPLGRTNRALAFSIWHKSRFSSIRLSMHQASGLGWVSLFGYGIDSGGKLGTEVSGILAEE